MSKGTPPRANSCILKERLYCIFQYPKLYTQRNNGRVLSCWCKGQPLFMWSMMANHQGSWAVSPSIGYPGYLWVDSNWDHNSTERICIQYHFWKYSSSCYSYLLIKCPAPLCPFLSMSFYRALGFITARLLMPLGIWEVEDHHWPESLWVTKPIRVLHNSMKSTLLKKGFFIMI